MVGDYVRVLHKLSEVLKRQPGGEVEATEKATEAMRLRMGQSHNMQSDATSEADWAKVLGPSAINSKLAENEADETDEERYDRLVYILWR